ncbi:MAG: aldo/keto reductase [Alphaproteobacteria bacterium]|nr:aldo/keto reductase [Alphaproteobacteria bacterium]
MAQNMMLPKRPFGKTGKDVSVLGLGTVKFGRNRGVKYPGGDGFDLPSDAAASDLLDLALDLGINLLDTAPAYGQAEERLGTLLGARRDKFFLVSKTGEEFDADTAASEYIFTAEHARMSVERSLKRLHTDYLDCVLVHANRDDVNIIMETPVLETLARMKDAGKILSFGVSTYSVEGGCLAARLTDCVMLAYNVGYLDEVAVLPDAQKYGAAVLVKKGLASGHLGGYAQDAAGAADLLGENIRFVLGTPGVTSMVFGSLSPANIRANVAAALRAGTADAAK